MSASMTVSGPVFPVTSEGDLTGSIGPGLQGPLPGSVQLMLAGATLFPTVVSSGATAIVPSAADQSFLLVSNGGKLLVESGGTAEFASVAAGGTADITSGGRAVFTRLVGTDATPAVLEVQGGGTVAASELVSAGVEFVLSGASDINGAIADGSFLMVAAGGTVNGEVIGPAGIMELAAGAVVSAPIRFGRGPAGDSGSGGSELIISGVQIPTLEIGGFDVSGHSQNDTIDLPNIPYTSHGFAAINATTHLMVVDEGGTIVDFSLVKLPSVPGETAVRALPDATGGTEIVAACFAAGTSIATEDGAVAVEALAEGMWVRLAEGGSAPVVWIGHRRIECGRHPEPEAVWPVRIAPHAFGMGRPARPLWLSRDHAVFIDGVLIPVLYLLNGVTVAQVPVERVSYFHVELPRHAVLLAEGLPCESYLDTGNRAAFANGGTTVMAHADFARGVWAKHGCAPLVTAGPIRDRVLRRLAAQGLALGAGEVAASNATDLLYSRPRHA